MASPPCPLLIRPARNTCLPCAATRVDNNHNDLMLRTFYIRLLVYMDSHSELEASGDNEGDYLS